MKTVYIDLNIFDRLEKIDRLPESETKKKYLLLKSLIDNGEYKTVYSNAHLNDLFRGFEKNPTFTEGHLLHIEKMTDNWCICQYWGEKNATMHKRNIHDFFEDKKNEWEFSYDSYEDLVGDDYLIRSAMNLYKNIPLPIEFKAAYSDPIIGIMFPLSKIHNNYYYLQADIFNFQSRLSSDYAFYKSFRSQMLQALNKVKKNAQFKQILKENYHGVPSHLDVPAILEVLTPNNKTSENAKYSKLLETFMRYDFAGYKADGSFNNMFDDGLHTFYASHFDCFITNDDRCAYKAKISYKKLGIDTKVLNIEEINILQTL